MDLYRLSCKELTEYLANNRDIIFADEDWNIKLNLDLETIDPWDLLVESVKQGCIVYVTMLLKLYNFDNTAQLLSTAVLYNHLDILEVLLEFVKDGDDEYQKALEIACRSNNLSAASLLFRYRDLNPNIAVKIGVPLFLAINSRVPIKPDTAEPGDLVKFLMSKTKPDPSLYGDIMVYTGWTPLSRVTEYAIEMGSSTTLQAILDSPNMELPSDLTCFETLTMMAKRALQRLMTGRFTSPSARNNAHHDLIRELNKIRVVMNDPRLVDLIPVDIRERMMSLLENEDDI